MPDLDVILIYFDMCGDVNGDETNDLITAQKTQIAFISQQTEINEQFSSKM
jgi:hypothetical protein